MPIRCETSVLDSIVAHALKTLPAEACGLLEAAPGAQSFTVVRATPCANRALLPSHRFQLDPIEFLAAERRARDRGTTVVGVYHSHPRGPARLSHDDLSSAWPEFLQVLCDLSERDTPSVRAFAFCGSVLAEVHGFVPADWTPTTCLGQSS